MKTLQQLQPLILEWAKEKDLIKSENAPKQRLKLIEECGELASAILKNDIKEQKDAIGDIFVVLIILAEQLNSSELYFENYTDIIENHDIDSLIKEIINYGYELTNLQINGYVIEWINALSIRLNHDITECANLAWNEIKDRKGKTINGTFIKNE